MNSLRFGSAVNNVEDVLNALRRVIRATDVHSRQLAKNFGLTTPQILLLQTINTCGAVTIGELAQHMRLSQATVTTILDRLERRGLVTRERSHLDKRKVHAYLTPAALEALKSAPSPMQDQFVQRFRELRDWEQSMIVAALQRVADMMEDGTDINAAVLALVHPTEFDQSADEKPLEL